MFVSAVFFAGWLLCAWIGSSSEWFWIVGPYVLTGVLLIEGSWRIVPAMLIGFSIAEAGVWWLFYTGDWYYPDWDDELALAAIGCSVGALVSASWLLRKRGWGWMPPLRNMRYWVPAMCFVGGLFFGGAWAGALSQFALDRVQPELAACVAVTLWIASIWNIASRN